MVRGLDIFSEFFKDYSDHFVLIGGTASSLLMEEAGADFRATKDLDIVLLAEALTEEFVERMWTFIEKGGYQLRQKGTEKRYFYRFQHPADKAFPAMLEFFSRQPDGLSYTGEGRVTPLPMDEDLSSLSAILLDEDYYNFLLHGKIKKESLPILGVQYIIPFKAKAWLDLTNRKSRGDAIDSKAIKKHKNDIFRLVQIVERAPETIPESVSVDMKTFLESMKSDPPEIKSLGITGISFEEILSRLEDLYG